jgi:hypothetical protein
LNSQTVLFARVGLANIGLERRSRDKTNFAQEIAIAIVIEHCHLFAVAHLEEEKADGDGVNSQ